MGPGFERWLPGVDDKILAEDLGVLPAHACAEAVAHSRCGVPTDANDVTLQLPPAIGTGERAPTTKADEAGRESNGSSIKTVPAAGEAALATNFIELRGDDWGEASGDDSSAASGDASGKTIGALKPVDVVRIDGLTSAVFVDCVSRTSVEDSSGKSVCVCLSNASQSLLSSTLFSDFRTTSAIPRMRSERSCCTISKTVSW